MGDASQQRMVQNIQLKSLPCSGSAQVNVKFSVIVCDICTIIDLDIVFAGGAWIFKNEQRNRDAADKKELTQVE